MNEPYKRLDETNRTNNSEMDNVRQILSSATTQQKPRPKLKLYHGLVLLAFIEVCIAVLVLLLGISCTAVGGSPVEYGGNGETPSCTFGTAIWVGILCLVAGTLGLSAFRVPQGRKGFMVAYMIFCILTSVADGILIIFSSIWIMHSKFSWSYSESRRTAALCFNSFLLIIAFVHMMLSIISSAFVCYNWNCCGGSKPDIIIVYASNPGNNSTNGDSIKFLPPNIVPGQNARVIYA